MRIKAKLKGDKANIKVLIKHDMESGRRKDEAGNVVPAKFVQTITAHVGETQVLKQTLDQAFPKNPFLELNLTSRAAGDAVAFKWVDSTGDTLEETVTL